MGWGIAYLGYIELEIEAMGVKIPDCGFLVVKEPQGSHSSVPGLLGMNILNACRELVYAQFDTTLGIKLDSDWREVFQQMHRVQLVEKSSMGRIAG